MARPDKVYVRFRGTPAANLTGVWGDDTAPDLINVKLDGSGLLVAADQGEAIGVVWTPEGKASFDVANANVALAGAPVTVFVAAEFVGTFDEASTAEALTAGEGVWSADSGTISDSAPGSGVVQQIGFMVASDEGDTRLVLNVVLPDA